MDFIQTAVKGLGLTEGTAESATAGLLGLIQKKVAPGDFDQLLNKMPEAKGLMGKDASPSGAGGLGGMLGAASSALGSKLGGGGELLGALGGSGLDTDKIAPFVGMFVSYIKSKGGTELVTRIVGQIPELGKLTA